MAIYVSPAETVAQAIDRKTKMALAFVDAANKELANGNRAQFAANMRMAGEYATESNDLAEGDR